MSDNLKPYEKAGRLVRLFAWLSLIGLVGIAVDIIVLMFAHGTKMGGGRPAGGLAVGLIIFTLFLFTYFQFALGTAMKQHKNWGRNVGIGYAILQLFGFPIGTVIGAYILYCLIKGWDE